MSSFVFALSLPPPKRGSTNVPRPTRERWPGVRGDVAEQMRNHALRQVIGLDLVGDGELLQFWHKAPVPPDHSLTRPR